MKIIEDLYLGRLSPEFLDSQKKENEAREEDGVEQSELYEKFLKSLSKEQKEEFREVEDLLWVRACEKADEAYIRGFKTGAKVIIEIYQDE